MKKTFLIFLCFLICACAVPSATPTPTQKPIIQRFSAEITMAVEPEGKIFKLYSILASINFSLDKKGELSHIFQYVEPTCYPSGNVCSTEHVNELIKTSNLIAVVSGCWRAEKIEKNFDIPKPCDEQ